MDNRFELSEDRFIEQCHAYFDGLLSPEESEQLHQAMAIHPDWQAQFEDLRKVCALIQDHAELIPSTDLEGRVLASIAAERLNKIPARNNVRLFKASTARIAAAVLLALGVGAVLKFSQPVADTASTQPGLSHSMVASRSMTTQPSGETGASALQAHSGQSPAEEEVAQLPVTAVSANTHGQPSEFSHVFRRGARKTAAFANTASSAISSAGHPPQRDSALQQDLADAWDNASEVGQHSDTAWLTTPDNTQTDD